MVFEEARRLKALPPYLFAEIDRIINEKKSRGVDVISLGIGDPDIPTSEEIIEELCREAKNPQNHRYPSSYGLKLFKEAAAKYYMDRFGIEVDPETEVLALWGSKEGISNIAYVFINPGDIALIPDPGYLVYNIGTMFAGGKSYAMPCMEENKFLPDIRAIDKKTAEKSKIMHLNYPNNPTSASCSVDFFKEARDFAAENSILVCHDNAYCDVYFDEQDKPTSFLSVDGAKEIGIEFNSLSKTFNMTGWRVGFAVGNRHAISSLGKYKTNVDSGVFNAIQFAGITALKNYYKLSHINIEIYRKRRQLIFDTFDKIGLKYYKSSSTIYVWAKVPKGYTSKSFAEHMLDKANVVVTPGSAFGIYGEGYYRISITISDSRLNEALERIQKVL